MRRPSGEAPRFRPSADDRLDAFFSGFLARHPRFLMYVGVGLGALLVVAWILVRLSAQGT